MIGSLHTSDTFSLAAMQVLQDLANTKYIVQNLTDTPLPSSSDWVDVTTRGLTGDGVTDDTAALVTLAGDVTVTNWYFPLGVYRLYEVDIPPTVQFVHGLGTIMSHDNGNSDGGLSVAGGLKLAFSGFPVHDDFVLDGLSFDIEPGFTTAQNYGQVTISRSAQTNHLQIRNCTFNGANGNLNAIKVFTDKANHWGNGSFWHENMVIRNNLSDLCTGFFDFEFVEAGQIDMLDSMPGFRLFNNQVTNGSGTHGAISYVRHSSEAQIYNNDIEGSDMALEILSERVRVYSNRVLNSDGQALSLSNITYKYGDVEFGNRAKIYQNHIEITPAGFAYAYMGCNHEIYDNYILGNTVIALQVADSLPRAPYIHDNTIVCPDDVRAVKITNDLGTGDFTTGEIRDNKIYNTNASAADCIYVANTDANFIISGNTNYISNTATCITLLSGTDGGGNVCTNSYSGTPPTTRDGAGLSDAVNIGPQLGWLPNPNPAYEDRVDITDAVTLLADYGEVAVAANGVTDDLPAIEAISLNTNITNWYIPAGKTVRMSRIDTVAHVTHIWGGGSVMSVNSTDSTSYCQSFDVRSNVVFDGLTFLVDTTRAYIGGLYGCHIGYFRHAASNFSEIRNCTFNGKDSNGVTRTSDLVKVGTDWDGIMKHENLKIYNNNFVQAGHFAMEIGDQTAYLLQHEDMDAVRGLEIFNNYFDGRNQTSYYQGISMVRIRRGSAIKIFNNKFEDCDWGIELHSNDATRIYNNEIIGCSQYPLLINGVMESPDYSDDNVVTGVNFVYDNHIVAGIDSTAEYPFIYTYYGNKDEWYNNFMDARVKSVYLNTIVGIDEYYGGYWHDNIFINQRDTSSYNVDWQAGADGISLTNLRFIDNEVFGLRAYDQNGLRVPTTTTNIELAGNNIYMINGVECITNGHTQNNGDEICDLSWNEITPPLPTGLVGAGLSDPGNIGPQ